MIPTRKHIAFLLLALPLFAAAAEDADSPAQLRGFPETRLTITHAGGRDSFRVWIADSGPRQQQGLMFVRRMAPDRGMLFPQGKARPMAMWMKNTYLPLDMVFIGEGGLITGIAENTEPLSLATIESPGPVTAVLELNAGETRRRGIHLGDRIEMQ